jgi:hypothetical protein
MLDPIGAICVYVRVISISKQIVANAQKIHVADGAHPHADTIAAELVNHVPVCSGS